MRLRPGERAALGWLARFVRPHRARLAAVVAFSLASTGLGLAQPYITKFLVDDGLLAGRFDVVVWLCALMVGVGIAAAALGALNRWHYTDVSARVLHALRQDVFAHLLRLSPAYHARARRGDLMTRIDGDLAEVQRFGVDSLLALVNGAIALAGALALMLSLSWQLSLLALVLVPVNVVFLRHVRPRVEQRTRTLRERTGAITSFFFDRLAAIKLIQSVAGEARESERLAAMHRSYRGDLLSLQMTSYAAATVPGVVMSIGTAAVFVAGGHLVVGGTMTLGTLIAFSVYLARALGPVQTLLGLYVALQRARVSMVRVMEVVDEQPAVTTPRAPMRLPADARGTLRLEGVRFAHDADAGAVLDGVDAHLEAGSSIGICGISGAGKSTLIDLLQRHYDPQGGRILLDGVDLRRLDLAELRRRIAIVGQDTVLFSGSVAENIRFATPGADDEALREAARHAEVDRFVQELPAGYDTPVGERGAALSGGQRQRIAIARSLLQDPLVLVLDEATSEIDRETEERIGAAIDRLFAGRTRIVISHRAETLAAADRILEMRGGHLVERDPATSTGAGP